MPSRPAPSIASVRADWLGARAALAGRHRGRFVLFSTLAAAVIGVVIMTVPTRGLVDRPPTAAMAGVAIVVGLIIGFSLNLIAEMGRPAVADAREAERLSRLPVLATVRDAPHDIDPYQLLHLSLSATGAQTRVIAIAGDESAVVSTVAAQLALAAAAESRATLVLDTDAERSGVAAYFDQRPEPGFTDALAGVRLWSEVTRAVGARRGLLIDVVTGGAVRGPLPDEAARVAARHDCARFAAQYDLAVFAVSGRTALQRLTDATYDVPIIWCVRVGATSHVRLRNDLAVVRGSGVPLRGLLLWDEELPVMRSRSDQMRRTKSL
jgi:hypothetical protein